MNRSPDLALAPFGLLGPIRVPRIFEGICDQIRGRVRSGDLKPGDKLPPERELSLQFGASRTAVREALRSLEMAGIVELRKGAKGGAFITEGERNLLGRSLRDMIALGTIRPQGLVQIGEVVQEMAIRHACRHGTAADYDALDECLDLGEALRRAGRHEEARAQRLRFHRLLAAATRNDMIVVLMEALTESVRDLAATQALPGGEDEAALRRVVRHLRDGQAERAVEEVSRPIASRGRPRRTRVAA